MKTGLAQDTTKSAKNLAQQIARQMAREPLEVLKTASSQVTGEEKRSSGEFQSQPQTQEEQTKLIHHQQEIHLPENFNHNPKPKKNKQNLFITSRKFKIK